MLLPIGAKNQPGHKAGGARQKSGRPTKAQQEQRQAAERELQQRQEEERRLCRGQNQKYLANCHDNLNQDDHCATTQEIAVLHCVCNGQRNINSYNPGHNLEDEEIDQQEDEDSDYVYESKNEEDYDSDSIVSDDELVHNNPPLPTNSHKKSVVHCGYMPSKASLMDNYLKESPENVKKLQCHNSSSGVVLCTWVSYEKWVALNPSDGCWS